mmetsp:Transcript_64596/g.167974  ORF Transcript_64596/g.167974 Transcript_64596/m.167974 type:complete len:390 (+) Transcript_64596:51-1220(+)
MHAPLLRVQALTGAGLACKPSAQRHVECTQVADDGLKRLGIPAGLARLVAEEGQRIGSRMYLLDNSGSTSAGDGSTFQAIGRGRVARRPCTRWEEISAFAEDHARWNLRLGTPCVFVLLNSKRRVPGSPIVVGRDCVCMEKSNGSEEEQLHELRDMLKGNGPCGVTPISERLEEIRSVIQAGVSGLAQRAQMVSLILVTDGLPTPWFSGESTLADKNHMVDMMRSLCASLPVLLVIRLFTQDAETVNFYNSIRERLAVSWDILDNLECEAQELAKRGDGWFAYTPVIHRMREAGTCAIGLNAEDGRPLSPAQVRRLAGLLSGSRRSLDHLSDRDFINEMTRIVAAAPLVYDVRRRQRRPILDVMRLRAALKVGFRGVVLPGICACFRSV